MKRQRATTTTTTTAEAAGGSEIVGKKKPKKEIIDPQIHHHQKGEIENVMMNWEIDQHNWIVDEEMPWGSIWLPLWDMDFTFFYNDVVWDDDIWDLNTQIPYPFLTHTQDWIKLNTDGSCIKESEAIGGGGIIRNHDGAWIKCFHIFLGSSSSLLAEIWAIDVGINLAASLNLKNIIVESDNLLVVNMLNDNGLPNIHHMFPLIHSCSSGLNDFEQSIIHQKRELLC
ncbi:ribonuclease h protein [Senna tora]|uniref:Ribonuclease h protein n=1 Tax=Senna tora TaxID=362788 RepID=A0A834W7R6_9FABA|nr:ribonuclease h protein [Senna tora]